ncbi:SH3 domain-containing protein 19, partial [Lucilia cuprina]
RISKSEDSSTPAPAKETKEPANVSGFAARFAAKEQPKAESKAEPVEEPEEEEPEAPAPPQPKRNPEPVREPEPKAEPEPEPELESEGLVGHALQDYEAGDDDEISFKEGEDITGIDEVDENWYIGRNKAGKVGMFPAMYVQLAGKSAPSATASALTESEPKSKSAIAVYDYAAGDEDELSFDEGETITQIQEVSPEWWSGENSKQEYGLFPSNYVKLN